MNEYNFNIKLRAKTLQKRYDILKCHILKQTLTCRYKDLKDIEWHTNVYAFTKSAKYHCSKLRISNMYGFTHRTK